MKKLLVLVTVLFGFALAIPYETPQEIAEVMFADYTLIPTPCADEDRADEAAGLSVCYEVPRGLDVQEAGDVVEARMMRVGFVPAMFGWLVADEVSGVMLLKSLEEDYRLFVMYRDGRLEFHLFRLGE